MLTRGYYIGQIIDDLAHLKYEIEMRNKLGQFDLSKFCEDFFKEVLNATYDYNLSNLNSARSNYPGIDLGDTKTRVAFQITSQKTSEKINETLEALTEEQLKSYDAIFVFIIGNKQKTYTINEELAAKCKFALSNIMDIDTMLRDVVLLSIDRLETVYNIFKSEFRQLRIELEPVDATGNFESSYFNSIEIKPSTPPKNAIKLLGKPSEAYAKDFNKILELYDKLAAVPKITREILFFIVDRGKFDDGVGSYGKFSIIPQVLERILRLTPSELLVEINILENENLVYVDVNHVGDRPVQFLFIASTKLNELFLWANEEGVSIRTLLNTMDFTILDE